MIRRVNKRLDHMKLTVLKRYDQEYSVSFLSQYIAVSDLVGIGDILELNLL